MEFVPAAADDLAAYAGPPPYLPVDPSAPPPHQPYHYYAAPTPNPNSYPTSYAGAAYETSAPPSAAVVAAAAYSHYQSSYGADAYAPHGGYAYQLPASAAATSGYAVAGGNGTAAASYHGAAEASRMVNYPPTKPIVGKKRAFEDMEAKKQKLIMGGAAADSVRICMPCNVVCNSETVYAIHLAGEKHSMKVFGYSSKGANAVRAAIPSQPIAVLNKASQKKAKVVKPVPCNICKLECDTEEVLAAHMVGKKHMRNMMRLESSTATPAEKALSVGESTATPAEKALSVGESSTATAKKVLPVGESSTAKPGEKVLPVGDKQRKPAEDLEAKKQTMLDNGTRADAIKVCTVCNIPCNGQAAFDSHVSGQRHINLLKSLQQEVASVS